MKLPNVETLLLKQTDMALEITLNRPEVRNAMSLQLVDELVAVFAAIKDQRNIRAVVLRGAGGSFCAGADIKDMAAARSAAAEGSASDIREDPFFQLNRRFGTLMDCVNRSPQVVIAVLEGAVLGGGFGLACVSDVAIALESTKFGLPETGLGIPPAQIAPFVVTRIGLTQARRLALLGARFDGREAQRLGIVHTVCRDESELQTEIEQTLKQVRRCAPSANVMTKEIIMAVGSRPLEELLDSAAEKFARAVQGEEGTEGTLAFIEKRLPKWAQTADDNT